MPLRQVDATKDHVAFKQVNPRGDKVYGYVVYPRDPKTGEPVMNDPKRMLRSPTLLGARKYMGK